MPWVAGYPTLIRKPGGYIAQLVVHRAVNAKGEGSSPSISVPDFLEGTQDKR
jgi:hypothetical protein